MQILAIDLGKFKSVACRFDTGTQTTEFVTLATERGYLTSVLSSRRPDLVVFEACALSGWVADLCGELNLKALVANPSQEAWRWKNVKRKTDRDDALKLAKLAALGQLVPVHVPPPAAREYRRLVKYRQTLVGRLNRVQNTIRALFTQQGIAVPRGNRAWTVEGLQQLGESARPLAECSAAESWRGILDRELQAFQELSHHLAAVDQRLDALAKQDARVQRLLTIPGVGRKTAEVIVAYLDDPRRFQNARQLSAYAGLVPRQFQSGEMDRRGGITHRGPRVLRAALVECAWLCLRYNPWAKSVYERIRGGQKTRRKQALVAVARKLLVRCWVLLMNHTTWEERDVSPAAAATEML